MIHLKIFNEKELYNLNYNPYEVRGADFDQNKNLPDWAKLNNYKCSVCPFTSVDMPYCPAIVDIIEIIRIFEKLKSYEMLEIRYSQGNLNFSKTLDCQKALSCIFAERLFTSACPILNKHHMMMKFIPPLPDLDQLNFHLLADAILRHYVIKKNSDYDFEIMDCKIDFKAREDVYMHLLERIRFGSKNDGNLNAMIALNNLNILASLSFDQFLEKIRGIIMRGLVQLDKVTNVESIE